jgi:hypothetical protein
MMHPTAEIYRDILARTAARYLSVRPGGIEIAAAQPLMAKLPVTILTHGAARTLYHDRRPACRSLDGVRSVQNAGLHCASCGDRERCTPQVRLDLVFDNVPYRLLLAFTSAKNFLLYHTELIQGRRRLDDTITLIRVVNRGSWGELRFSTVVATGGDKT